VLHFAEPIKQHYSQFMTVSKNRHIPFIALLFFSCKCTTQVKNIELIHTNSNNIKDSSIPSVPIELKVSAYLIYKDSTTSFFDILNDKTIIFWNTIIGAGDAEKPSERIKIVLMGKLDSLEVITYNGKIKIKKS
jgi:hypothetical protein